MRKGFRGVSVSDKDKFQNMRFKGYTGSKLIGRLSILGVEGYGFKSRFPDVVWDKCVRINDYTALNGNIGSFDNP